MFLFPRYEGTTWKLWQRSYTGTETLDRMRLFGDAVQSNQVCASSLGGVLSHLGIPGWTEGSDSSPCALPLGTYVCTLSPFGWLALVPRSVCSCGRILLDPPHNM